MINGQIVVVILPAYNAEATLRKTFREIPMNVVDEVLLTDDASGDDTVAIAREIGIRNIHLHPENRGYGSNQKTCYEEALKLGADIVIMLHPDYQYDPKLIPDMAGLISANICSVVLGSRFLGRDVLSNGMPLYKFLANRALTSLQNFVFNRTLSEYHTGYRAYSADVLRQINFQFNSNDFIFDNEMLSQIICEEYAIEEIACPASYDKDASSIGVWRSIIYGFGVLRVTVQYFMHRMGWIRIERYALQNKGKSNAEEAFLIKV